VAPYGSTCPDISSSIRRARENGAYPMVIVPRAELADFLWLEEHGGGESSQTGVACFWVSFECIGRIGWTGGAAGP
jgi:hypothetical protein